MSGKKTGATVGAVGGGIAGGAIGGPIGAGIGIAAGGAVGGLVGGWFDDDKPQIREPDANDYQWGGDPNAYGYFKLQSEAQERDAMNRAAPTLDWSQSDESRGLQMQAAQSYQDVLAGKAPSLAEMQMRQGVQQAAQNSMNVAASGRGGAGNQLLAAQAATRANAAAGQDAAANGAMLRAREQDAARAGLLGAGSQMRQGDLGQQGLVSQNELAQRGMNDALVQQARDQQFRALEGRGQMQARYGDAKAGAYQYGNDLAQRKSEADDRFVGGLISTGGAVAGMKG